MTAGGDPDAWAKLLPAVYDQLRAIAARVMRSERPGHTLQPTALVHEAVLRLMDSAGSIDVAGQSHLRALVVTAMRRVLIDHARSRVAAKGAGGLVRVTLQESDEPAASDAASAACSWETLLRLEALLETLGTLDRRTAEVAALKVYGLETATVAAALGLEERTVQREWKAGRAWLAAKLKEAP